MSHLTHLAPDTTMDFADDLNVASLGQGIGLWGSALVNYLVPPMMQAFQSLFDASLKLCKETNEPLKYLQNFQNVLSTIHKWNENQIEEETKRIINQSHCDYLEDMVTSIHLMQLKTMSCMRVSSKSKKIELDIPSLPQFIHKCYVQSARLFFTRVYLFQLTTDKLKIQENNSNKKQFLEKAIFLAIMESIPKEKILRAYMDESIEEEVEVIEELIPLAPPPPSVVEQTASPPPPPSVVEQMASPLPPPNVVEQTASPLPPPNVVAEIEVPPAKSSISVSFHPNIPDSVTEPPQKEGGIQIGEEVDLSIFDQDIEVLE